MIVKGTSYNDETPTKVVNVLEYVRRMGIRVRLFYGDTATGEAWPKEHDVTGTLSRSRGPMKVPLLLARSNSTGGDALLDHCIVAIKTKNCWLYEHSGFETGFFTIRIDEKNEEYPYEVYHSRSPRLSGRQVENQQPRANQQPLAASEAEPHARFKTEQGAARYCRFMAGARFSR
jgi:hypothetical protein